MSIQALIRPFIVSVGLTVSGSAFAGPPAPAIVPVQKAAVKMCEEGRPAPGYRQIFTRFGVTSQNVTGFAPMR
jgi:hypothetical protein